jgi:diguanylate cyclase (GGDEF)-like protein/PAS domain S-box-containing protein
MNPGKKTQLAPESMRRREYRAIAVLLVLGMVIWMAESFVQYSVGSEEDAFGSLRPYLSAHGMVLPLVGIVCFIGYGIYVTRIMIDVRAAEQKLQESEERYRLLTHNSLTGIYIQQGSVFVYVNERMAEMTGYRPEELIGKGFRDIVHPEDRSLVEDRELGRSQGKEVVQGYEFRLESKDGSVRWVELLATSWRHLGRDDCMGNLADISERKQAESEREQLISDLVTAREALHFQATHDALTGLLNRSATLDALAREVARAGREKRHLAVIMADLDDFKRINDTYGHLAGDAVLQAVAQRMRSSVRAYDLVGRYGGEELLIALPGCDCAGAVHFAERVRTAIADTPVQTKEGPIHVTLSLGVASMEAPKEHAMNSMIREADRALYVAKESGRNRTVSAAGDSLGARDMSTGEDS